MQVYVSEELWLAVVRLIPALYYVITQWDGCMFDAFSINFIGALAASPHLYCLMGLKY